MNPHRLYLPPPIFALLFACLLASCGRKSESAFTPAQRQQVNKIVTSVHSLAGLDSLHRAMRGEENVLGQIVVLREWGKHLRNESRFEEALEKHGEGLRLAEQADDTLETVQALNNIGTDYRRMGILDAAQQYHKKALMMAEESADTSFWARKNRVVSLNGLANVYLTINNYHLADSCLRLALAGETELGSLTGQAINCANIGSIFQIRGVTDSAWAYYRKSMQLNREDGNALGVALCHTFYGNLYVKGRRPDKALAEFNEAYKLMRKSKDEWHLLSLLTSMAEVHMAKGDESTARSYLQQAEKRATKIHSTEHLAEIYTLYYRLHKSSGDYPRALRAHERAAALKDSLLDMEKVNRMQSASYNIERGKSSRRIIAAHNELASEKAARRAAYIVFAIFLALLATVIGLLIKNHRLQVQKHESLKKLNSVRESFFTNITHEFRTPLTVILGLCKDLQGESITRRETQETGVTLERHGRRMLSLINQLLDLSKIRSAGGRMEWKSGNIAAYIYMIVEAFESYAAKRGIKLQFFAHENEIDTDFVPDYVNKILTNLLSNALKFTQAGRIDVSLWREDGHLRLDVSDTGRGIPKESLPNIFEAFYQSDNIDGGIGTGVGLSLVHQIVKQLGGDISVNSTEGRGTTFHITLPIRHENAPALDAARAHEEEPLHAEDFSASPDEELHETSDLERRVLIVEDNADVARLMGKRLGGKYSVSFAQNGEEALKIAREKLPDAIVTDLMMPQMDGLELTRRIRADELTSHIPIVIVTAKVTGSDRIEGIEAGADAYLTKPFSSDELLTRINKLLESAPCCASDSRKNSWWVPR